MRSAPEWFPLRGTAASQWKVGCTYLSPYLPQGSCDDPTTNAQHYHPWWALDLFQFNGAPVYAAGAGFATRHSGGGYGDYVVVDHRQHGMTLYAHLSSFNIPPGGAWVD